MAMEMVLVRTLPLTLTLLGALRASRNTRGYETSVSTADRQGKVLGMCLFSLEGQYYHQPLMHPLCQSIRPVHKKARSGNRSLMWLLLPTLKLLALSEGAKLLTHPLYVLETAINQQLGVVPGGLAVDESILLQQTLNLLPPHPQFLSALKRDLVHLLEEVYLYSLRFVRFPLSWVIFGLRTARGQLPRPLKTLVPECCIYLTIRLPVRTGGKA